MYVPIYICLYTHIYYFIFIYIDIGHIITHISYRYTWVFGIAASHRDVTGMVVEAWGISNVEEWLEELDGNQGWTGSSRKHENVID